MHVPDGFINAPVSVAAGVVAAGAVAGALRGARFELRDRAAPLAGLVAAFVFAVQMLNFPVAGGTSGHLLGGALAAVLVGPATGVLCVAVVLLVQGLLFADGGLTALGVNISLMGVVTVLVAYATFRLLSGVLPAGRASVLGATFLAAFLSVPVSAVAFTGVYALGGTAEVSLGKVFTAMVGVHLLIGLGEAVITTLTVGAVLSVRPDLVYAARGPRPSLTRHTVTPATPGQGPAPAAAEPVRDERATTVPPGPAHHPGGLRSVWLVGLGATLLCAGVLSFYASAHPDGLEKVAADQGIADKEEDHAAADSLLADYGVKGVSGDRLSGGLAGLVGAGGTLALGTGAFVLLGRGRSRTEPGPGSSSTGETS
ncbi:energy-coupling factor ABC transporter permease [Streptomyces sp. NPDC005438]|uniref:energy-coupling factor ABC transporter permease n=1 Tax=Streptomyces sp. NPDC005438 TaxID=3156880 RepID=UPI0033AF2845